LGTVGVVADLVRYVLDDGTEVLFESTEADLVSLHTGAPDVKDGGRLSTRLETVARTARQLAESIRKDVEPDEIAIELGVKIAGEVNWWFFANNQAEATVNVTLTWKKTT
jgi:hypothetical protein